MNSTNGSSLIDRIDQRLKGMQAEIEKSATEIVKETMKYLGGTAEEAEKELSRYANDPSTCDNLGNIDSYYDDNVTYLQKHYSVSKFWLSNFIEKAAEYKNLYAQEKLIEAIQLEIAMQIEDSSVLDTILDLLVVYTTSADLLQDCIS